MNRLNAEHAVKSLFSICSTILNAGVAIIDDGKIYFHNAYLERIFPVGTPEQIQYLNERLKHIVFQDAPLDRDLFGSDKTQLDIWVRTGILEEVSHPTLSVTALGGAAYGSYCLYLFYFGAELSNVLSEEVLKGVHYDYFTQLFEKSPIPTALLDNMDRVIQINESFSWLFGYGFEEVIGCYINDLIANHHAVIDEAEQLSANAVAGSTVRIESTRYRKDGTGIPVGITAYPVWSRDKQVAIYAMYTDMRERRAYEEHMKLYLNILENSTEAICILDPEGRIYWKNNGFRRMIERPNEELFGRPFQNLEVLRDGVLETVMEEIRNNGSWKGEISAYTADGRPMLSLLNGFRVNDTFDELRYFIFFFDDITDYKRREEQIHFLSSKDSLTGLTNRATYLDALKKNLFNASSDEEYAVLYIDLDDFKLINDSINHAAGDEVLKYVSEILQTSLRDSDLLSRCGGDEFAIAFKDRDVRNVANQVCKRIFNKLKTPIFINDLEVSIRASIGMAFYPEDGMDAGTLVRHAEIAMYRAKREFKNSVQSYNQDMKGYYHEQYYMRNALRSAIRNGELYLMYQPVVDIETEHICGFEALCRWDHPTLGSVPPSQFIPLAETGGMIVEIGEWILEEACRQMKEWLDMGFEERFIAVNFSVKQLEATDLVGMVRRVLEKTGLPTHLLEVEVTESIQIQNPEHCSIVLDQLQELGVSIAMDDFGTGYSSLAQISRMALNKLKIDRSFINDYEKNRQMIDAIVAMACSLNLKVVAEGVEEAHQVEALRRTRCDFIQGYYFYKPLLAEDVRQQLSESDKRTEA